MRATSKLGQVRAETDFALARALCESGGAKARAVKLAEQAEHDYTESAERYGSRWFKAEAETIHAWRSGHAL